MPGIIDKRPKAAVALLAAAMCAFTAAPAGAAAGSILYLKHGKLRTASPNGKAKHKVPHKGRFLNPSQADNGTIVAQRGINLYRLNRRGKPLNKPITTAFRTNPLTPDFNGPLWPEVSPNGKKIAYTYSFTAARYDPGCDCTINSPSLNTSYTSAKRFVEDPVGAFGNARMYNRASWIDNSHVLMTTTELFDFAGNVLDTVAVDTLGGGSDSYQRWFSQCNPCDSLQTLQLQPLDNGEMTRQRDKLVFVSGPLGSHEPGSSLAIYRMNGAPPALPPDPCTITGATGKFDNPTWSPDGKSLAWADSRGIWVGQLTNIVDGGTCEVSRRLVIPGGTQPDWGPARP